MGTGAQAGPLLEGQLGAAERAALTHARSLGLLEDVVRWGLSLSPPTFVRDVVVQDEYTHDVVLVVGDVTLVFDTT